MAEDEGLRICQSGEASVNGLFDVLWVELRRILGSAPAAALLKRSLAASRDSGSPLGRIVVQREGRDYDYDIPDDLTACGEDLTRFVDDLLSLLHELTGSVMVRHLLTIPEVKQFSKQNE